MGKATGTPVGRGTGHRLSGLLDQERQTQLYHRCDLGARDQQLGRDVGSATGGRHMELEYIINKPALGDPYGTVGAGQ